MIVFDLFLLLLLVECQWMRALLIRVLWDRPKLALLICACRPFPRPRSMGGVTSQLSHEASHGQSAAIIAIASPLLADCMHGACAVSFKLAGSENAAPILAGRN